MSTLTSIQLTIGWQPYGAEIVHSEAGRTVRLTKDDGTAYDVTQGPTRTTCDCPDFRHRHTPLDFSEGCKHVKACVAAGLVENVKPFAPAAPPTPAEKAEEAAAVNRVERKVSRWDRVDFHALAARYRAGAGLGVLSRETGIPRETIADRFRRIGVQFRGQRATGRKHAALRL